MDANIILQSDFLKLS